MQSSPKSLLLCLLFSSPLQLRALDPLSVGIGILGTSALITVIAIFNPAPPNVTINQTTLSNSGNGVLYATLASPAKHQAQKRSSWGLNNLFNDIATQDYIKCIIAAAGVGYGYTVYTVIRLQQYLQEKTRISFWFNQYDFNKLLLLDQQQMHGLLAQEFMAVYNVRDQKTLKEGIHQFIADITSEIAALESYITILNRLEQAGNYGQYCSAAGSSVIKTLIPFGLGKVALSCLPQLSINGVFFIDVPLKDAIQERISRLHYYKNIFLQSTIDV